MTRKVISLLRNGIVDVDVLAVAVDFPGIKGEASRIDVPEGNTAFGNHSNNPCHIYVFVLKPGW